MHHFCRCVALIRSAPVCFSNTEVYKHTHAHTGDSFRFPQPEGVFTFTRESLLPIRRQNLRRKWGLHTKSWKLQESHFVQLYAVVS